MQYLEDNYPPVYSSGLNTRKNGRIEGTLTVLGAASLSGGATVTGALTATSTKGTVVVLTPGTTVSLDPTLGNVFTLVPGQAETINAASVTAGQEIQIVVTTSGSSSFTLTFGTGFKTTGTLATGTASGKVFVMDFVSDGTNFNEVSRTTAM